MYASVCGAMVCANLALYTIYVITAIVAGNKVSTQSINLEGA